MHAVSATETASNVFSTTIIKSLTSCSSDLKCNPPPWRTVHVEKQTITQLLKKFLNLYRTIRIIIVFIMNWYSPTSSQMKLPHMPIRFLRPILIPYQYCTMYLPQRSLSHLHTVHLINVSSGYFGLYLKKPGHTCFLLPHHSTHLLLDSSPTSIQA